MTWQELWAAVQEAFAFAPEEGPDEDDADETEIL